MANDHFCLFYVVDEERYTDFIKFCKDGVMTQDGTYDEDDNGNLKTGVVNWLREKSGKGILTDTRCYASPDPPTPDPAPGPTDPNNFRLIVVVCPGSIGDPEASNWGLIWGFTDFLSSGTLALQKRTFELEPLTEIDDLLVKSEPLFSKAFSELPTEITKRLKAALVGEKGTDLFAVEDEIRRDFDIMLPPAF